MERLGVVINKRILEQILLALEEEKDKENVIFFIKKTLKNLSTPQNVH